MARPSSYKEKYAEQARKLCLLGATDAELADFFGVQESTINNWKKAHPEFLESIKEGKIVADINIAEKLHTKASGYNYIEQKEVKRKLPDGGEEVVIVDLMKHCPSDTTALIFWLKNRKAALWRDKQDVQHSGTVGVDLITNVQD